MPVLGVVGVPALFYQPLSRGDIAPNSLRVGAAARHLEEQASMVIVAWCRESRSMNCVHFVY